MAASVYAFSLFLLLLLMWPNVDAKKARRFLSRTSSTRSDGATSFRSCASVSAASADSCQWNSGRSSTKITRPTKRHIAPRAPPRFPLTYDGLFRRRRSVAFADNHADQHSYVERVTSRSRIFQNNNGENFVRHDADTARQFNHVNDKKSLVEPKMRQYRKIIYSLEDRDSEFQNSLGIHHRDAESRFSSKNRAFNKRSGLRSLSGARHHRKTRNAPKINHYIRDDYKKHFSSSTPISPNDRSSKISQYDNVHWGKIPQSIKISKSNLGKETSCSGHKNPEALTSYRSLTARGSATSHKPYKSVHILSNKEITSDNNSPAIQFQASSVAFNSFASSDVSAFHNGAHHAFHRSQNIHPMQGHGGPHPVVKSANVHVGESNKIHEIHHGHNKQSTQKAHSPYKRHDIRRTQISNMVQKTRNNGARRDNPESFPVPHALKVRRSRRRKKKRHTSGFKKVRKSLG